ncbi:MAG: hypothetical protein ACRCW6_02035 [Mycoplasmoidaceae bacterium]
MNEFFENKKETLYKLLQLLPNDIFPPNTLKKEFIFLNQNYDFNKDKEEIINDLTDFSNDNYYRNIVFLFNL